MSRKSETWKIEGADGTFGDDLAGAQEQLGLMQAQIEYVLAVLSRKKRFAHLTKEQWTEVEEGRGRELPMEVRAHGTVCGSCRSHLHILRQQVLGEESGERWR